MQPSPYQDSSSNGDTRSVAFFNNRVSITPAAPQLNLGDILRVAIANHLMTQCRTIVFGYGERADDGTMFYDDGKLFIEKDGGCFSIRLNTTDEWGGDWTEVFFVYTDSETTTYSVDVLRPGIWFDYMQRLHATAVADAEAAFNADKQREIHAFAPVDDAVFFGEAS